MHRTFTTERRDAPTFNIDDEEIYECVAECPSGVLLDLAQMTDEATLVDEQVRAFVLFLDTVLVPESRPVFQARLRDPARPVSLPMLMDITAWLIEAYTARPTSSPSDSPSGPSTTGSASTDSAPSKASTRSTSRRAASSTS